MAYIDDIVIATETIDDHIARIKEVFECLREAGFKMRAEKCDFVRKETKYLGRVVSAEGNQAGTELDSLSLILLVPGTLFPYARNRISLLAF